MNTKKLGEDIVEQIVLLLWRLGAVIIRDVDAGQAPFVYASGNHGPGYISVKGCVGNEELLEPAAKKLSKDIQKEGIKIDFVAGLMTGGVIPGYRLSQLFSTPFVYLDGTRRKESISGKIVNGEKLDEVCIDIAGKIADIPDLPQYYGVVFIAGVAPNGMVPGFRVAQLLNRRLGTRIPYVYIREKRKKGGLGELITGVENNPHIYVGSYGIPIGGEKDFGTAVLQEAGFNVLESCSIDSTELEYPLEKSKGNGLVVEELVNFAESTGNAALWLRERGATVDNAATILNYNNPNAVVRLREMGVELHYVLTLLELLDIGEKYETVEARLIQGYRDFLKDPLGWQAKRGLVPVKEGGTL